MKASIIITCYNQGHYLGEALQSALGQSFPEHEYEIIVVNDGSTDNTSDVLGGFAGRIKVITQENRGLETACNAGIKVSTGEYVVRLDADDSFTENLLLVETLCLDYNPGFAFTYSDYFVGEVRSKENTIFKLPQFDPDEIRQRGDFLATGTVYRRECLNSIGLFDESHKNCGLENYDSILRLIEKGYKGYRINIPLFFYRKHDNNKLNRKHPIWRFGEELGKKYGFQYTTNRFRP